MIQREYYKTRKDGVNLYKTSSTENLYIQKVGTNEIYSEAIDVEFNNYEYVETDKVIEDTSANEQMERELIENQ